MNKYFLQLATSIAPTHEIFCHNHFGCFRTEDKVAHRMVDDRLIDCCDLLRRLWTNSLKN